MRFQDGYVYHVKDEYFIKANDDKLMQNKENGNHRPTFFCMRDESTNLLWMVPMSTRIEKYQKLHDKQVDRYGKCLTIVIGEYDGRKSAFLLQNMFPVTEKYLDHIHTRNGNPVPVKHSLRQEVRTKMKKIRKLLSRGYKMVFPDVERLERIMIAELKEANLERVPLAELQQSILEQRKGAAAETELKPREKVTKKEDFTR